MAASHRVEITDTTNGETREYLVPAFVADRLAADAALAGKLASKLDEKLAGLERTPRSRPGGELGVERLALLLRAPATGRVYWQGDPHSGRQHITIFAAHDGQRRGPAEWIGSYPELPRGAARLHENGELVVEGEPLVVVCDIGRAL